MTLESCAHRSIAAEQTLASTRGGRVNDTRLSEPAQAVLLEAAVLIRLRLFSGAETNGISTALGPQELVHCSNTEMFSNSELIY